MKIGDVHKLQEKKYRKEYNLYLIQGEKSVDEALNAGMVKYLFSVESLFGKYKKIFPDAHVVSHSALASAGTQSTADGVIALATCDYATISSSDIEQLVAYARSNTVLVLDGLNDPGNLGTIVRTADWFGITHIVCSEGTVDIYNPKCIAATMGSFVRTHVHYGQLHELLRALSVAKIAIFGAVLDGTPLFDCDIRKSCALIMGSESHGIERSVQELLTNRVTIPQVGGAESLNVSVATGIILSHIK